MNPSTDPESTAPGPVPAETVLSDRAGDVIGVGPGAPLAPDPLHRAISTLDQVANDGQGLDGGGTSARGRDRRRQIVQAAATLFAERGYRGTSLRDISRVVGISHPGMLHHFRSKEALLEAVVDELEGHAQHTIDHLDAYTRNRSALDMLVRRDFGDGKQRMLLFAVLTTDVVNPEHPARMRMIRLRRVYERIAERVLQEYEENGLLAPEVDIEWAARTIISLSIALATREATIGVVQPSAAGRDVTDYLELLRLMAANHTL